MRRRKVIRTGLAYLGVAFVVLQAADLTFEPLGFPTWSYTAVVIAAIVGLPIALVLSWFYDLTSAPPSAESTTPTAYRPATVLMLGVVALALIAGSAFTAYRLTRKAPRGIATLAVFPFVVRSAGSFSYLGEGMVDLLSRNLDGAGVRAIAPEMMLTLADKQAGKSLDPRLAATLAQQAGGDLFILGSITHLGADVQISAALHEVATPDQAVASRTVRGDTATLFSLIDQLSAQLMVARTGREGKRLADVAALTTSSLAALRDYVEGERHYRLTRYDSAIAKFESASTIDTTFAIAHYRLATASMSGGDPSVAVRASDTALRHASGLAARDRRMIEALSSFVQGRAEEAEQRYRSLIKDYPGDLEATFQLADCLVAFNPGRGLPVTEARGLYEQVQAADPGFLCATCRLAVLAMDERDYARVAAIMAAQPPESPMRDTLIFSSLTEFIGGDAVVRERVLKRFERASEREIMVMAEHVVRGRGDYAAAERLLTLLLDPQRPPLTRRRAYNVRAIQLVERGRVRDFLRDIDAMKQLGATRALMVQTSYAEIPFIPFSSDQLRQLRDAWLVADSVPPSDPERLLDSLRAHLRLYALGTLSARLDDTTAALTYADRLQNLPVKPEWNAVVDGLATEIRAHVAARQGRVKEALAMVESIPVAGPFDLLVAHYPPYTTSYWRAELLYQNGRDDEAVRWFQNAFADSDDEGVYQPMVDLRLAQIYERKGDRAKALEHYAAFLRQWESADPEALPLVDQARAAMTRLRAR